MSERLFYFDKYRLVYCVPVVQLVEYKACNAKAMGSIPREYTEYTDQIYEIPKGVCQMQLLSNCCFYFNRL